MNHLARQTLRNEAAARQVASATERMSTELAALDRQFEQHFPKADCQNERTARAISEINSLGSDSKAALSRIAGEIKDRLNETYRDIEKLITCAHGNGLSPDAAKTAYGDLDAYLTDLSAELVQPIEREVERRRAFP